MSYHQQLDGENIIAIMRGVDPKNVSSIAQSLKKGGIRVIEITLDSPNALEVIKQLSLEEGDNMLIGAGTVLDPESARMAIHHGAKFIISPTLNIKTIEMTKRYGVLSIPGCLTPTEILTAYENGADMVKVFPASSMGANYFKDLSGPLSYIPLIATGGINENNIQDFIKSGVTAVGLGSSLIGKKVSDDRDLALLIEKASRLVKLVNDCKNN
ncbi:bifunctional 4-hydroxy-2-oxoglutarate aldolase/2-dehydro-3-deoxy-phosphogluconate aldolase [Neobacillus sp. YIM B02564]|uniref:Bifunctional 4-hydroxy-2-oxoglutarate aldolase/2-dehydro-3-deoxy-phosphogluconate aldolase n=1 Tax=Neobacillus paridis TaxID=2803862 RepID=A0ABS1TTT0_9BACI|nr:bifunctional 4-hydroxy-2-oxoglutarate aldolase/2-dehydro-3-deoxy-phosphogluconate aldolase [Neobacillus paridis]MBL4954725.1 bifunctional 4-hydroxy-2-oxoglutarate aldolase/2-dehydro-3-deoxy-phosphogluconate aldolase [Neobacillus paridis]